MSTTFLGEDASKEAFFNPSPSRLAHEAQTLANRRESGQTAVLAHLPPDVRNLTPEECEMLELPKQALVQELHLTLGSLVYTLRSMKPRQRARYAAGLVMRDWSMLAEQYAEGAHPQISGLVGVSPIARPYTLQRLGAQVRPGVLSHDDIAGIGRVYKYINGQEPPLQTVTQFAIGRNDFIESGPIAGHMADVLLCENGGV